MLVNDLLHL